MFEGEGTLTYPSGIVIKGIWKKGVIIDRSLCFADGLKYSEYDWKYCTMPDRRFSVEYSQGLHPAANSLLTADQPTRDIHPERYDTIDGFFEKESKAVYKAEDPTAVVRCPVPSECKWIIENCRSHEDGPVGPRVDLYEEWADPMLSYAEVQKKEAEMACSASKSWGFEDFENEDDEWTLKYSLSKAHMSLVATRSVAEFGARQQKLRQYWGDAAALVD